MEQLSFLTSPSSRSGSSPRRPAAPKTVASSTTLMVYVDGASRNNPGKAGAGAYLTKNGKMVEEHGCFLGLMTNNQAEYYALLLGVWAAKNHMTTGDRLEIVSDSELLVRQMLGQYKVKNQQLKVLKECADTLLEGITYRVRHVLRDQNQEADRLANEGIDKNQPLPVAFRKLVAHAVQVI